MGRKMKRSKKAKKKQWKKISIICIVFACFATGVMLLFMDTKEEELVESGNFEKDFFIENNGIIIDDGIEKMTDYLCIPLPETVGEDQVAIEDIYINKVAAVEIEGVDSNFYKNAYLLGSSAHLEDVRYGYANRKARIELVLDGIYEHESIFQDGYLYIKFIPSREVHNKIVVVDGGHGGNDGGTSGYGQQEKEVVLDIILRLKEMLDQTDIKVYYTRLEDTKPSFEDRVDLANLSRADLFVSIHINGDSHSKSSSGTEVLYNESFFTPKFGSKDFAKIIQDELVKSLGSRDRGIIVGDEIAYIVRRATVPVALAEIGFLTNKEEALLIAKDSYKQQAAKGIYNGILRAFDEREEISKQKINEQWNAREEEVEDEE